MKAVRLHRYGGPEVLVYEDAPDPVAGPGELLIAVEAVGVNPADFKFRYGWYDAYFPRELPLILGMDVAGTVAALGAGVDGFSVGQKVFGMIPHTHTGGYAELVAAPAEFFALLPAGLDVISAAALATPGITAVELIEDDLDVRPGQRIIVTGATGGVGRAAVFAARRRGVHVTAAVRANRQAEAAAITDAVILTDAPLPAGLPPFDSIADTVGGEAANGLLELLKPGGVLSSVSTTPVGDTRGLDVISRRFSCHPDPARLAELGLALAAGRFSMPPVHGMKLAKAAEAHRLIEAPGAGKIVLDVDP
jgi:NADPH:quinone reductase-like Zn-dependent oxidoreductase